MGLRLPTAHFPLPFILETQSIESVCAKAEEIIQAFLEATETSMAPELIEKFGDMPI